VTVLEGLERGEAWKRLKLTPHLPKKNRGEWRRRRRLPNTKEKLVKGPGKQLTKTEIAKARH